MSNQTAPNHTPVFCEYCSVSMDRCKYSRRCFMTGEYCSKQQLIQKTRKKLHEKREINAFVVMNFSSMSDVVYNWRIQDFVADLKKYLRFEVKYNDPEEAQESEDQEGKGQEIKNGTVQKLYCYVNDDKLPPDGSIESLKSTSTKDRSVIKYETPTNIHVIRADSAYASNFVMCNRVCQQMQIADLIIVDVSVENANVFYELGMCMAMGKLILPMCYTNSYFAKELPKLIRDSNLDLHELSLDEKNEKDTKRVYDKWVELQNHIACYPWRKRLFEYYGIRYRNKSVGERIDQFPDKFPDLSDDEVLQLMIGQKVNSLSDETGQQLKNFLKFGNKNSMNIPQYIAFEDATNPAYGFEDIHYNEFPYSEAHVEEGSFGRKIYERLQKSFNLAGYSDNTLIIYTIDGFENEKQAGRCIVNYYKYMTVQIDRYACFCGDRVGTLVQENKIPEDPKDSRERKHLTYNVSEVIHIGVNHATTTAYGVKVRSPDLPSERKDDKNKQKKENDQNKPEYKELKKYSENQSMMIYPDKPVYVRRIRTGMQSNPLSFKPFYVVGKMGHFYCLYHVMLRNLKFTRELVVDISGNSSQSLFWLGMAHGADIYAITVKREEAEAERLALTGSKEKHERNLFDVSGLWTAILQTEHANDFYRQLALAQMGIEHHSKLMIKSVDDCYKALLDPINTPFWDTDKNKQKEEDTETKSKSQEKLESYYRSKLWRALRKQNRLWLYLCHEHTDGTKKSKNAQDKNDDPKVFIVKWDVNAAGRLSNYLSKRSPIGEYHIKTLEEGVPDDQADHLSFISIGADTAPLKKRAASSSKAHALSTLVEDINLKIETHNYKHRTSIRESEAIAIDKAENSIQRYLHTKFCRHDTLYDMGSPKQNPLCKLTNGMLTQEFRGFASVCEYVNLLVTREDNALRRQFPLAKTCIKCDNKNNCFPSENADCASSPDSKLPKGKLYHTQLAQLVLWREIVPAKMSENDQDKKERMEARAKRENYSDAYADDIYYRVALNGVSGPATEALTVLLIDPDDSTDILRDNDLLCQLQKQIRLIFLETYQNKVKRLTKGKNEAKIYAWIKAYLQGALYQYAFPFLSRREERQILNGLKYYLRSHMDQLGYSESKKEEFSNLFDPYVQALRELLWGFQGVEAFYEVSVLIEAEKKKETKSAQADGTQPPDSSANERNSNADNQTGNTDGTNGSTKDNRTTLRICPCKKETGQEEETLVNCVFL